MKKDKKFLLELESKLKKVDKKSRESIVLKYRNIIDEKIEKKIKIAKILRELGDPSEIAKKEIEIYKKNKPSKLKSFFSFITKDIQIKKKNKKEKVETKKENKSKEKIEIEKETKSLIKRIINHKKDSSKEEIKEEAAEVIEENKEESVEIKEEIVSNEDIKRKRILKILGTILICLLTFIWLWIDVVTIASFFALLDGVKLYGISISLIGISLLVLLVLLITINTIYKKGIKFKYIRIVLLGSVVIIALGIAFSIYEIYKIDCVSDVSEKYSMQRKIETYSLPTDENINMYILFNGNYDTQYIVNYDESLSGKVKIEVDYYEAYYDYYAKQSSNNIYVSLRTDNRDMISTYISDLKDKKIYSKDELSRYVVKITTSKKDYSRLVIED